MRAGPWLLTIGAATSVALGLAPACTTPSEPDRVIVEEGSLPPEAATTISSTTHQAGSSAIDESWEVTTAGFGEVRFGMTVEEAQSASGTALTPIGAGGGGPCYELAPEGGPAGITFVVNGGRVLSVEITEGGFRTPSGAGIGDSADEISALFGDRIEEDGDTLTFVPADLADATDRIIFVITDGAVSSLRAGRLPEVAEGCP